MLKIYKLAYFFFTIFIISIFFFIYSINSPASETGKISNNNIEYSNKEILDNLNEKKLFNNCPRLFSSDINLQDKILLEDDFDLNLPDCKFSFQSEAGKLSYRGSSLAARVVQTAYKYLGVPYVWGGTTPDGFDCSGFVQRVYQENGVYISRTADTQFEEGKPVLDLEPGDLVFFTTYLPGASHVGIYLANSCFIHASSRGQVMVSTLQDDFYKSVFLGGRRYFE